MCRVDDSVRFVKWGRGFDGDGAGKVEGVDEGAHIVFGRITRLTRNRQARNNHLTMLRYHNRILCVTTHKLQCRIVTRTILRMGRDIEPIKCRHAFAGILNRVDPALRMEAMCGAPLDGQLM